MLLLALLRDTRLPGQEAFNRSSGEIMVPRVIPSSSSNLFAQSSLAGLFPMSCTCFHCVYANCSPPWAESRVAGSLTFPLHAHDQALLIAAVLTAVTLTLVDEAVLVIPARVDEVFPYGSLEEAFAAFTTVHTIVLSWPQEKDIPQVVLVFICVFHSKEPLGSPQKN